MRKYQILLLVSGQDLMQPAIVGNIIRLQLLDVILLPLLMDCQLTPPKLLLRQNTDHQVQSCPVNLTVDGSDLCLVLLPELGLARNVVE